MSSRFSARPAPWSLTRQRAEVLDLLRRHYETQTSDEPDVVYDSGTDRELLAAIKRALSIDDASKEAVRPMLGTREVAALLRERFGARDGHDDPSDVESDD